jgi:hypothetical protein
MLSVRAADDTPRMLIAALAARPGWTSQHGRNLVHAFGSRQSAITIPPRFDAMTVASIVIRAELNALLGDCEWPLLSALQELAARELERLSASVVRPDRRSP